MIHGGTSTDVDLPTPVWALGTSETPVPVPEAALDGVLTAERLTELRYALAAFSATPIVTLEARPLTRRSRRSTGITLDAASPLASELARLVAGRVGRGPVDTVADSTEVLYRMVVPAKVVAEFGKGLVKPMQAGAVQGGVYSSLVNASHTMVANAAFVPVERAAAGAATSGAAGTAVGTIAAGSAITVAAPLVLMAIAVGASAYADLKREQAIERVTELLEQLHDVALDRERNELDGCRDAIDKATALLLDRGRVGASLGLDSAVHEISVAMQAAARRVARWEDALRSFAGSRVDPSDVERAFPGVLEEGGTFRAHLELAALATALKRRVVILQAVEAGQSDRSNAFDQFAVSLRDDQRRIDELEARIAGVLRELAALELRPSKRLREKLMTRGQVDSLLATSYRLRRLDDHLDREPRNGELIIEVEQHADGTLLALPARTA